MVDARQRVLYVLSGLLPLALVRSWSHLAFPSQEARSARACTAHMYLKVAAAGRLRRRLIERAFPR